LFSGMYIDFMGTDAAIFRSLTKRNAVRTDQHNSKWLSEPIFIDAQLIPDGTDPNDAKLYFFFRERLTDNDGNTKHIHTMVARVCPRGAQLSVGGLPGTHPLPEARNNDVVNFVRNHPVMFNAIYPVGRRPLVVRIGADYKYTSVAVDQVMAADGNYQVLFLGTGMAAHMHHSLHKCNHL
ncbi:hypothetical protein XENOCAPTIV_018123, partial [Xenoophorus captivus]